MSTNAQIIIPVIIYLAISFCIPLYVGKKQLADTTIRDEKKRFNNNFFIGGRSMGGFVLAMTVTATYFCASSYFGGPGIAYSRGLSWVYLAMIQVPVTYMVLGTFGKKMGIIGRKINAVTIPDLLRHRYHSELLVWVSSIAMVVFFVAVMVAQFMGGAILFQAMTGLDYIIGLAAFSVIVIIVTSVGGFKAVVTGDAIQGVVMLIGAFILLFAVIKRGGGMWEIKATLDEVMPYWSDATAGGIQSKLYTGCFWMLVGLAVIGMPQTIVRNLAYRDTKAVHSAMIISTIVNGGLMMITHFAGGLSRAFVTPDMVETSDAVVPTLARMTMHPVVCGIFLAGCMAAVMSTVSSVLIMCTSSIMKDLWLHKKEAENPEYLANPENQAKYRKLNTIVTLLCGAVAFCIAIKPPSLISYINLFATGGVEAVFLVPIVGGLYFKNANKVGAAAGSIGGFVVFLLCKTLLATACGEVDASIPGLVCAAIFFFIGNKFGKNDLSAEDMEVYFPTK